MPIKTAPPAGLLLAGDIGATNTRLALYAADNPYSPRHLAEFKAQDYPDFESILQGYLAGVSQPVRAASLGVAGPVVAGRVQFTNLPWLIDAGALRQQFGFEQVWLLNDLKALACSLDQLPAADLYTLQTGQPEAHGSRFVLAPGTGIGVSYLVWDGQGYTAHATEGGHADFAPASAVQTELLNYLRQRHPQVHVEHVCSGLGIPNIYDFLVATGRGAPTAGFAAQLATAADRTPLILAAGLAAEPGNDLCRQVIALFLEALAAEAGSLALSYGSTGGLYLGGGLPPRLLPALTQGYFVQTFAAKTGYEAYLQRMPIHVIRNTEAGLLGAAAFGWQQLGLA